MEVIYVWKCALGKLKSSAMVNFVKFSAVLPHWKLLEKKIISHVSFSFSITKMQSSHVS